MKIQDSVSLGNAIPAQAGKAARSQPAGNGSAGTGASRGSSSGDRVELSGFSARMSQVQQTSEALRAAKVERLAAEVRSGTYQVDAKAVSRAMIDHALTSGSEAS